MDLLVTCWIYTYPLILLIPLFLSARNAVVAGEVRVLAFCILAMCNPIGKFCQMKAVGPRFVRHYFCDVGWTPLVVFFVIRARVSMHFEKERTMPWRKERPFDFKSAWVAPSLTVATGIALLYEVWQWVQTDGRISGDWVDVSIAVLSALATLALLKPYEAGQPTTLSQETRGG